VRAVCVMPDANADRAMLGCWLVDELCTDYSKDPFESSCQSSCKAVQCSATIGYCHCTVSGQTLCDYHSAQCLMHSWFVAVRVVV